MLSEEQWKLYENKYGNLMWDISHKISGDKAIASLEDNYADLCWIALESIRGFKQKTGREFDDFFTDKLFDGYTKTCLWNLKNRKGAGITKKFPLTNKQVPLENEEGEVVEVEDKKVCDPSSIVSSVEYIEKLTADKDVSAIVECIIQDPSILNSKGRLNIQAVSKKLGKPAYNITKKVNKLAKLMRK